MRVSLLMCLLLALPVPALAQVTTDDQALKALQPAAPAKPSSAPSKPPPAAPSMHHPVHRATPRRAPPPKAPLPQVPAAPPPNPVIVPPPQVLPQHQKEIPPPVPVKKDAAGTVTPIGGGQRLTFGPGSADVNDATYGALTRFAESAKAHPDQDIDITAWAPGTPEDPSTPRRLSLDRALAARAVLIQQGIPSERIHAVANGFLDIGSGPADRLDITMAPPRATPASPPK